MMAQQGCTHWIAWLNLKYNFEILNFLLCVSTYIDILVLVLVCVCVRLIHRNLCVSYGASQVMFPVRRSASSTS